VHVDVNKSRTKVVRLVTDLLEALDFLLQLLDAHRLELTREQGSSAVILTDSNIISTIMHCRHQAITYSCSLGQVLVVLFVERQVLECHIDVRVSTVLAVKLLGVTTSRESMSVNLVLNLVGGIRHVNGRVRVRSRHLGLRALKRGQKFAMQQTRLGVFELVCYVSGQSELRLHVISMIGNREGQQGG
jgi:hypothetical protein